MNAAHKLLASLRAKLPEPSAKKGKWAELREEIDAVLSVAEAQSDPHSDVPDTVDSFGYEAFTLEGIIRKLQEVRDEDPRRAALPVYVNTRPVRVPVRTVECEPTHGFPVVGIFPIY